MLLSPASLKLMGKGFILGDFLGTIPFSWNPDLQRPELNLSRKRIAGCLVSLVMTLIGAGVMMGRLSSWFGKWEVDDSIYYPQSYFVSPLLRSKSALQSPVKNCHGYSWRSNSSEIASQVRNTLLILNKIRHQNRLEKEKIK